MTEDGKTHVTNPNNFRDITDVIEKMGSKISVPLTSLASSGLGAAVAVTSLVVGGFCNSASTSGFKQHILREGDSPTTIHLKVDGVEFHSKSGSSSTGSTVIESP